jgi:hypothetical protein
LHFDIVVYIQLGTGEEIILGRLKMQVHRSEPLGRGVKQAISVLPAGK